MNPFAMTFGMIDDNWLYDSNQRERSNRKWIHSLASLFSQPVRWWQKPLDDDDHDNGWAVLVVKPETPHSKCISNCDRQTKNKNSMESFVFCLSVCLRECCVRFVCVDRPEIWWMNTIRQKATVVVNCCFSLLISFLVFYFQHFSRFSVSVFVRFVCLQRKMTLGNRRLCILWLY